MVKKPNSQVVTPILKFTRCDGIRSQAGSVLISMNTVIEAQLNAEDPYSFVATQQRSGEETRKELAHLSAVIEQLEANNKAEHQQLSREAKNAIAQLSTDGQFLDHVREIIRFFKTA